jgi:hypothetical protein
MVESDLPEPQWEELLDAMNGKAEQARALGKADAF